MREEKIKPIPGYIVARIKKYDEAHYEWNPDTVRFYSYLTKNDGELVKITVAVKTIKSEFHCKQVAVHGLHSKECFVKDMKFCYMQYYVGWYDHGVQKSRRLYEGYGWQTFDDKSFDPKAPVINIEYLDKLPEYKNSAANLCEDRNILQYLRFYEQCPQVGYLMKEGVFRLSKQFVDEVAQNKDFTKWLIEHRDEICNSNYNIYTSVIIASFRTGRPIAELRNKRNNRKKFRDLLSYKVQIFFEDEVDKFMEYLDARQIDVYSYEKYFNACDYLGIDMSEEDNRYPEDFEKQQAIRIGECKAAQAKEKEIADKKFYDKFAAVARKYAALEYDKNPTYTAIIAKTVSDIEKESEALHVGFYIGESFRDYIEDEMLFVFFIRKKSATRRSVCYGGVSVGT